MKFSLFPIVVALVSSVYAAPGTQPSEHGELEARGSCGSNRRDCECSAEFSKWANPPELGSTVRARISGQDSGLTTSDWRGANGNGQASLCRVTVDRVCGNCYAWKARTDKCGFYSLSNFGCIPA